MDKPIQNLYFFFVILFSGMSISFFRIPEGLLVLGLFGLIGFHKSIFANSGMMYRAIGIWMLYFVINLLIIGYFHAFFMLTYIIKIMIAWVLLSYFRGKVFEKFENAIFVLSIISLFFYVWQLVDFDSIYNFIRLFDFSQDLFPEKGYHSIIFYSIIEQDRYIIFPRNPGFTWEPGPFSSYIILAMFFNLARNKVSLKDIKRQAVFLVVLITTQSTTGFLGLITLIMWYAWNHSKNILFRSFSIPLAVGVTIFLYINVPFLQEKISERSTQDSEERIEHSIKYGNKINPGRFASFQLALKDFIRYPVAGIGGHKAFKYGSQGRAQVSIINGLGRVISSYGVIGLLIFLALIIKSGKWYSSYYNISGFMIFPLLILIIGFSFGIIESPIIVVLWMVPVFLKPNLQIR